MANTTRAVLFAFTLGLLFYFNSLQPTLSWGDGVRLQQEALTGESFILAELVEKELAYDPYPFARLGIAAWDHPLYVVLGYGLVQAASWALTINPLWVINAISALFGAASLAVFTLVGLRQSGSLAGAGLGALALMVSHTFWWHATTPEVYTLHLFLLLLSLALFLHFLETEKDGALNASALVFGLALSNHFLAALLLPPVLAGLAWQAKTGPLPGGFGRRKIMKAALFALAGAGILLVQALRMLRSFSITELVDPLVGAPFFQNLSWSGTAASLGTYMGFLTFQFSPFGLALGLLGFRAMRRAKPEFFRLLLPAYVIYALFGVIYQVADQFAFHLTSYALFALGIPFGVKQVYAQWRRPWAHALAGALAFWALLSPALLGNLPQILRSNGVQEGDLGIPQIGSGVRDGLDFYLNPNKRDDVSAVRFGVETLTALPPGSLVLAEWYFDTDEYFIFRYFQSVEAVRPDVTVVGWPLEDPFDFDPGLSVGLVEASLPQRPVFISSLNETIYGFSTLAEQYCVYPSLNLYRVEPFESPRESNRRCLSPGQGS